MEERIYLSPPHMGEYERRFVEEAFATNWIAPLGPNVSAFEQELADYVGMKGAVALSSGTAAIHLALRLLGITRGDRVFCSSFTFVASANPILYLGAEPVFIDSEPASWNMSVSALERAFSESEKQGKLPKAVIVVNLYGQSADYDPIRQICTHYDVPVVEDAAESLGATYKGAMSGTIGQFGIYSFNGNKIITTSGGGMLVSDDLDALERARFLATQARDSAGHYQHSEVGYNYRMSNVSAGIGRGQLRVLETRINQRRSVFQRYFNALSEVPGIEFMPEAAFGRSTRWLTALTMDPAVCSKTPEEMVSYLDQFNIESRRLWKPMHLQPLFSHCEYYPHSDQNDLSGSLFNTGLCLPSGSSLTEDQQNRVIDTFIKGLM